jgi:hypothetical protein
VPCFATHEEVQVGEWGTYEHNRYNSSGSTHQGLATAVVGHGCMGVWIIFLCLCGNSRGFPGAGPVAIADGCGLLCGRRAFRLGAWRGLSRWLSRGARCAVAKLRQVYAASTVPGMLRSVLHLSISPCTRLHQLHPLMGCLLTVRPACPGLNATHGTEYVGSMVHMPCSRRFC